MSETATAVVTDRLEIEEAKIRLSSGKRDLDAARDELTKLREPVEQQIRELEAAFKQFHAGLYLTIESYEQKVSRADEFLREAAIAHFGATGEKTLDENLSVRVNTKLEYEMPKAVAWAEQNAPVMIVKSVDKKSFESLPTVADLDFVFKTETVTSVIKGL